MNKGYGILLVALFVSAWLGSDNVWAGNWNSGTSGANSKNLARIKQIMIGDARKGYKFNHRNVTSKKAFKNWSTTPFKSAKLIFLSTTNPST